LLRAPSGIGWSLAGTCPDPVAAQLGRGQLASVFTIAGVLMGVLAAGRVGVGSGSFAKRTPSREGATVAGL